MNTTKDQNRWCFFRNEPCKKEGDFSHPQIASSKKVFYSYSTKRRDADIIKRDVEQILKRQGFELITFAIPLIPSTAYYCEKICSLIHESAFIVADISPADDIFFPNVIFEVGLAGGCGKPMVLIASVAAHSTLEQLKEVWPTNLSGIQFFEYPRDFHKINQTISEFERVIIEINKQLLYIPAFSILKDVDEINEFHIKLEGLKTNRYLLGKFPLSIIRRFPMSKDRAEELYKGSFEEGNIAKYIESIEIRRGLFDAHLKEGILCREIYIKKDFWGYFTEGTTRTHKNPLEEIKERLERLKEVCKYPNYEIGLLNIKAPRYFLAKENYCIYIFSESRNYKKFPGEIISSRNDIVNEHIRFHEEIWKEISPDDKDKEKIIQKLGE